MINLKFGRLALASLAASLGLDALAQDLIWSDEFNTGSQPNTGYWAYDLGGGGWGNNELQTYTDSPDNVRVEGGHLVITAQEVSLKGKRKSYTSARLKTQNKVTFKYGVLEARIQVPDLAEGLWPAFWTLGADFPVVGWPACGELDVMEMGSASALADGVVNRRVGSTAHWEHGGGYAGYGLTLDAGADLNDSFHTFRMEWDPLFVSTYLNGQLIWTMDISAGACTDCTEFHQPHFIIMNMAVGGSYTGLSSYRDIVGQFPREMRVDWVRIYANEWTEMGGSAFPGTEVLVGDISLGTSGRKRVRATADVLLLDDKGNPVSGALVTGEFSGSHNEVVSAQTDGSGSVSLITSSRAQNAAFSFCVTNVSHPSLVYTPASNVASCDTFP